MSAGNRERRSRYLKNGLQKVSLMLEGELKLHIQFTIKKRLQGGME